MLQVTNATVEFGRTLKPADFESKPVRVVLSGVLDSPEALAVLGDMAYTEAMRLLAKGDDYGRAPSADARAPLSPPAPTIPPASAAVVPPAPGAPAPTIPPASAAVVPPAPAPTSAPSADYSDAVLATELGKFATDHPTRTGEATQLIQSFGVPRATQIPMERRAEFITRLRALTGAGTASGIPV